MLQTGNRRHLNHWFLHSETEICELNLFCKKKLKSIFTDKAKNQTNRKDIAPYTRHEGWGCNFGANNKVSASLITSHERLNIFRIQFSVHPKIFSCVACQLWKFENLRNITLKEPAYERSQGCGFGWRHRLLSPYRELFVFHF